MGLLRSRTNTCEGAHSGTRKLPFSLCFWMFSHVCKLTPLTFPPHVFQFGKAVVYGTFPLTPRLRDLLWNSFSRWRRPKPQRSGIPPPVAVNALFIDVSINDTFFSIQAHSCPFLIVPLFPQKDLTTVKMNAFKSIKAGWLTH